LGLAAFLGPDAGVGAHGVDEGEQRQPEALGQLHQPQRLAVALGARHAEVALELGLGVAALLVADHHHAAAVDAGEAADDRGVVGVGAVARQLLDLLAHDAQVVHGVRARRVARELRDLPRGQVAEDVRGALPDLVLQGADFGVDVHGPAMAGVAQLLDLGLQVGDRLLEVEVVRIHAGKSNRASVEIVLLDPPARRNAGGDALGWRFTPRAGRGAGAPPAPPAGPAAGRAGRRRP